MSTTEILLFVGLAALVIVTQVGRHTFSLYRLIIPLVTVALVGKQYLQTIPTGGGDLDFALIFAAIGVAFPHREPAVARNTPASPAPRTPAILRSSQLDRDQHTHAAARAHGTAPPPPHARGSRRAPGSSSGCGRRACSRTTRWWASTGRGRRPTG
jgi:hypothetical protein